MRIISGKWKGRRLTAPKNLPTRPTTDFAKEALFNILNNRYYLNQIEVLDLFAGIGSISFEFASRGATRVHSIEQFGKCVQFINDTKEKLELEQLEVFRQDVFQFLAKDYHHKYDLVFADPPFSFSEEDYNKILDLIFNNEFLNTNGTFILEHAQNHDFSKHPMFAEHKKYGNVHFTFFEVAENENE